jgi:hypothetical protein
VTSTRFGRGALILGVGLAMLLTSSTAAMAAAGRTESPAAPRNTAASTRSGAARAALARPDAIQQNASPRTPLFITYVPENTIGYECEYLVNINYPYIPITGYNNECNTRVWLHQDLYNGSNWGSGWTYCISPGEVLERGKLQAKYQNPLNIYISSNTSPC